MPDLAARIADWRARMTAALPQEEETIAELEEHLREHIAALQRADKTPDEAFTLAQARLGEPVVLAREFDRVPRAWWPARILLLLLAAVLAPFVGFSLLAWSRHMPLTLLQLAFVTTNVTGMFCVLGAGLVAMGAFVTTAWRPLRARERLGLRNLFGKLARVAIVTLPVGLTLGGFWRAQALAPNPWSFGGYPLRAVATIAAAALLTFVYARVTAKTRSASALCPDPRPTTATPSKMTASPSNINSAPSNLTTAPSPGITIPLRPTASPSPLRDRDDRVLWLTAIFAAMTVLFSAFSPRFRIADFPVAWFGAAFLAGQIFLALPRYRLIRVPETE